MLLLIILQGNLNLRFLVNLSEPEEQKAEQEDDAVPGSSVELHLKLKISDADIFRSFIGPEI